MKKLKIKVLTTIICTCSIFVIGCNKKQVVLDETKKVDNNKVEVTENLEEKVDEPIEDSKNEDLEFTIEDAIEILKNNGYYQGRDDEYIKGECISINPSTHEIVSNIENGLYYYTFLIDRAATDVYEDGSIKNASDFADEENSLEIENDEVSFTVEEALNQAIGRYGVIGSIDVEAGHELTTTNYEVIGDMEIENGVKYYTIDVSQTVKIHPPYEESGEYECDFPESRKFKINSYEDGRCD